MIKKIPKDLGTYHSTFFYKNVSIDINVKYYLCKKCDTVCPIFGYFEFEIKKLRLGFVYFGK